MRKNRADPPQRLSNTRKAEEAVTDNEKERADDDSRGLKGMNRTAAVLLVVVRLALRCVAVS